MVTPFEEIAFLATSRNRVGVLKSLEKSPRDRKSLQAELGISQPTASRILRDLRERKWIVRDRDGYELTWVGEQTTRAFSNLQEKLDAVHHLKDIAPLLPEEGFDFDLARLRTADVVRIAEGESGLSRTHENAHLASAAHVRILTAFVPQQGVKTTWHQVTGGKQDLELVIEADTVSVIRADPDLTQWTREMLASDRAEVYRYDGDIDFPILITDDTVHLAFPKDDVEGMAWISTTDEGVLDWAEAKFENHRERAEQLTEDNFPE